MIPRSTPTAKPTPTGTPVATVARGSAGASDHAEQLAAWGRKMKARISQHRGACAETLVMNHLRTYGILTTKLEQRYNAKLKMYDRKALADLIGCLPGSGRLVLVEVKATAYDDHNLPIGRLADHQAANLATWAERGAIALIAWVRGTDCALIPWGAAPGWTKRHPLPWGTAALLSWYPVQSTP